MRDFLKGSFNKGSSQKRLKADASLQITSMADIFIIILVFLLKSHATSSIDVSMSPGMKLPTASLSADPIEAVRVEVSESGVQVEQKPSVSLSQFRFEAQELDQNGASKSLKRSLEVERQRQNLISQSNSAVKSDSKILIIADQRTPYRTLKTVMTSAALNGFTDFKLVTVKKE